MKSKKSKMVILCVIPTLGHGGAQRTIVNLANYLNNTGHKVVIAVYTSDCFSNIHVPNKDVHIEYLDKTDAKCFKPKHLPRIILNFRKYHQQLKPNLVLSFMDIANFCSTFSLLGLRTRILVSERQDPSNYHLKAVRGFLRSLLYRKANRIVVQTKYIATQMPKTLASRVTVIPNHCPELELRATPGVQYGGKIKIACVCRLTQQKNIEMLIDAAKVLSNTKRNWELNIYGEGSLKDTLTAQIKDSRLENTVFIRGSVDKIFERLVESNIFILPSLTEGFPNSLAEAISAGLPAIGFRDVSGVSELIHHEENGYLLEESQRNPPSLSAALENLIDDNLLRERMGKRSYEISKTFKPSTILQVWENEITFASEKPSTS